MSSFRRALDMSMRWALVAALLLVFGQESASAAPPTEEPSGSETGGEEEADPEAAARAEAEAAAQAEADAARAALDQRRLRIESLLAGTLGPSVDPDALLTLDLDTPGLIGEEDEFLQKWLDDPSAPPSRKRHPDQSSSLSDARAAFLDTYRRLLQTPADTRNRLIEAQRLAHQAYLTENEGLLARRAQELATLQSRANQLEYYLRGTLDVTVDPRSLLVADLAELVPAVEADEQLTAALRRLRELRKRYVALSAGERRELVETHAKRVAAAATAAVEAEAQQQAEALVAEAEEANQQTQVKIDQGQKAAAIAATAREEALEAARRARSESARLVAEERARLLGVQEAQALFEVELNRRVEAAAEEREGRLGWRRRVTEMRERSGLANLPAAEVDAAYEDLRAALKAARERLSERLAGIAKPGTESPPVGTPAPIPDDVESTDLRELRVVVMAEAARLEDLERAQRWQLAELARDDIVSLNADRLTLLGLASKSLRRRMTGFGPDGVRQARRELEQIGLELRFHLLALPRHGSEILRDIKTSPVPLILALLKIIAAIVIFRFWRGQADKLLTGWKNGVDGVAVPSRVSRLLSRFLWYVARVRQPLEWLALSAVLYRALWTFKELPELEIAWLIVAWSLVGSLVILTVDAMAARDFGSHDDDGAALRIRSLRVMGVTAIVILLVLSLAEVTVGRGAIYTWVFQTCWFLSIPIGLLLVAWWRTTIFGRIHELSASPFTMWVAKHEEGWASFAAAAAGGVYLFGRGIARWVMRRAAGLETTRRVLAYLFRREVARQAEANRNQEALEPISDERRATLQVPAKNLVSHAEDQLVLVEEIVGVRRCTISAVIAEHGMGKSTFLTRLSGRISDVKVYRVACPPSGYVALLGTIGEALGLEGEPSEAKIHGALEAAKPCVMLIDDLHRLMRPAIGGLKELDRFTDFARRTDEGVSWVVTVGSAAWQYLSRARGERVFFDQVLRLRAWSEEELAEFLLSRSSKLGVEPKFDGLVVPSRYDEAGRADELERTRQGYFRIVWDYSDGNPEVALDQWSDSLFVNGADEIVVRLPDEKDESTLDDARTTVLFVLRALIQLELSDELELATCTQLPVTDVADALRFSVTKGWVERSEFRRYRVSGSWYRAVTNVLARQHLLVA